MAYVLIGFMGAGKSAAARELAAALGSRAADSDALLEERFGHPVAEEFARAGEQAFRAREEELVCELLADAGSGDVVALGGGSVLSERVRDALGGHLTVLLDVDADTAWARVSAEGAAERPLARDRGAFGALHESRAGLYESLADAVFPGGLGAASAAAAARSLRALAAAPAGTRLVWARAASGEYPVLVGRGLIAGDGAAAERVWPLARETSRTFCVSDEHVAALHGRAIGRTAATIALPPGEGSKTLAGAERVWHELVRAGMTRADHVAALGGGVVGDLAGFCAATYQRGVPVVHVPTTLVAQVDSAYGGKTGVDLPEAKNYVGAYHQPAGVLVDPDTLSTLPAVELAAGWVEVLKTGLIAGGALWERVSGGAEPDAETILGCARTKIGVVAADERDAGARQALNLGHTVGHAIETATGYSRYRHGEAVGLGLLAALRLSEQPDLRAQVGELLAARGLPVRLQGTDADAVIEAMARDKKRVGDTLPFVLVRAPGDVLVGCEVDAASVRAAVEELLA
jgi:3-dehydroquinate synthetase/shikimate kinase